MKVERQDIPSIARGRIASQVAKTSNRAMIIFGLCILAAISIKISGIISGALVIIGGSVMIWDIYQVGNKRKQLTKALLEEYDKEHIAN